MSECTVQFTFEFTTSFCKHEKITSWDNNTQHNTLEFNIRNIIEKLSRLGEWGQGKQGEKVGPGRRNIFLKG